MEFMGGGSVYDLVSCVFIFFLSKKLTAFVC